MPNELHPYGFLAMFLAAAVAFPLLCIALARVWALLYSPPKPGHQKNAIFECGLESQGEAWVQFRSSYYLYAIVFMIFDVEVLFLLPFAVVFLKLPLGAVLAMLVFVLLLVEGLVWAWRKGALTWN